MGLSQPVQPRSDSSQYGFGIARQSNTKPPPLPVLSSGNPRLYEKDRMVTFTVLPYGRIVSDYTHEAQWPFSGRQLCLRQARGVMPRADLKRRASWFFDT